MSLFKKMKLVPHDHIKAGQEKNTELKTTNVISPQSEEKPAKSNYVSRDERIINIIDSNLDGITKLEVLKKIFEDNVQVQKNLVKIRKEPIVISRKLLTPPSKKRKKPERNIKNSKEKVEFIDIPWKKF